MMRSCRVLRQKAGENRANFGLKYKIKETGKKKGEGRKREKEKEGKSKEGT
jgi:hypothetical protein